MNTFKEWMKIKARHCVYLPCGKYKHNTTKEEINTIAFIQMLCATLAENTINQRLNES